MHAYCRWKNPNNPHARKIDDAAMARFLVVVVISPTFILFAWALGLFHAARLCSRRRFLRAFLLMMLTFAGALCALPGYLRTYWHRVTD